MDNKTFWGPDHDFPRYLSPRIFASCDGKYAQAHGSALCMSAARAGYHTILHVVNATKLEQDFLSLMVSRKNLCNLVTVEYGSQWLGAIQPDELRTYYAIDRFLSAANIMRQSPGPLYIVDVDCLIMSRLDWPVESIGLFFRDALPGTTGWEAEGTKIAAGLVYVNGLSGTTFLERVCDEILKRPLRWFVDQVALNIVARDLTGRGAAIHHFTAADLDWEFKSGTKIWTGKGSRKHENATYLAKKKEFEDMISSERHDS